MPFSLDDVGQSDPLPDGTARFVAICVDIHRSDAVALNPIHQQGVPLGLIAHLAHAMGTTTEALADLLGWAHGAQHPCTVLPIGEVASASAAMERLRSFPTAQVLGLIGLIGQVQTMVEESGEPQGFQAAPWLWRWLNDPVPALGHRPPAAYMGTMAGQRQVKQVLAAMQSGAYL